MNIVSLPKKSTPFSLWEPTDDFADMFGQFHQLMNRAWREGTLALPSTWAPGMDVFDDEKEMVLSIDVPGMERKDIKIEIEKGVLTISGERKLEKEEKKANYVRLERGFGSFLRRLTLPDDVNQDDIKATCKDGLLKVTLTKLPGAKKETKTVNIT